jgi:hypothetical protein
VKALGAVAIAQRRYCGWSDVAMLRSPGDLFERVGHAQEFCVIPSASQKLNADRLPMIVESGRDDNGWNSIRCAGGIAAAEARPCTTSIVDADFA